MLLKTIRVAVSADARRFEAAERSRIRAVSKRPWEKHLQIA
jgi:hypothetical protein